MKPNPQISATPPARLRQAWWAAAILSGLALGLGYLWLPAAWHQQGLALRWVLLAGGLQAYLLASFRSGLADNHRPGETDLLPALGAGNWLTLLRGLAISLLAGFLFLPRPLVDQSLLAWTPAILYTIVSLLDYLDGYVARRTNQVTALGQKLDAICDALGVLVAVALAVWYGQLPAIFLLAGLAAYLFAWGKRWRQRRGLPVYALPPSRSRRVLAGFQMAFFSVVLWPLFSPPGTTLAGLFFITPVLAGFCRDWLVVSGRLDPTGPRYLALMAGLSRLLESWLLPLLRAGLVLLSLLILLPAALEVGRRQVLLRWPGGPPWSAELVALLALAATLLLALGILPRLAALGLLVPTAMVIVAAGLSWGSGLLLAGSIMVMLLGGGALALWRPDDTFVTRRAGERHTP